MAPAGAGMPTKKFLRQAGTLGTFDRHVETREAQRAGDAEHQRRQPAQALHLVEPGEIEHDPRRDAEIDEVGERIEFRAEARSAFERARDPAVEAVEHRRGGDRAHRPFDRALEGEADRRQPEAERQQRDEIGNEQAQRHGLEPAQAVAGGRPCGTELCGRVSLIGNRLPASAQAELPQSVAASDLGDHRFAGDGARMKADEDRGRLSGR